MNFEAIVFSDQEILDWARHPPLLANFFLNKGYIFYDKTLLEWAKMIFSDKDILGFIQQIYVN